MKNILGIVIFFMATSSFAQHSFEKSEVKKVVTGFFDAFHKQDSVALRKLAHSSVTMQSVGQNTEGKIRLSTLAFGDFLISIVSIPSATKFEEKLHSFEINVNGPLAHVVTPYTFYINEKLSHCGINSFTLVKEDAEWKISYLIDTRYREGCVLFQK